MRKLSSTVEDYIKKLYQEQQLTPDKYVPMNRLAAAMDVTAGTATTMIKNLSLQGLVEYKPRVGSYLSRKGNSMALQIFSALSSTSRPTGIWYPTTRRFMLLVVPALSDGKPIAPRRTLPASSLCDARPPGQLRPFRSLHRDCAGRHPGGADRSVWSRSGLCEDLLRPSLRPRIRFSMMLWSVFARPLGHNAAGPGPEGRDALGATAFSLPARCADDCEAIGFRPQTNLRRAVEASGEERMRLPGD